MAGGPFFIKGRPQQQQRLHKGIPWQRAPSFAKGRPSRGGLQQQQGLRKDVPLQKVIFCKGGAATTKTTQRDSLAKGLFSNKGQALSNNKGCTEIFLCKGSFLKRKALSNSKVYTKRFLEAGPLFYKGRPSATAKSSQRFLEAGPLFYQGRSSATAEASQRDSLT